METTHPETGVPEDPSIENAVNRLVQSQDAAPPVTEQSQASEQPETAEQPEGPVDEVTPEDVPEEPEQPAVDAFEIVHDGQQVKLSREEAIKYARQGFDYTQKTQALAEDKRRVHASLQALSEIEQVTPYLMQERAQVAALEQQLQAYQNFNWVKVATEDPLGYPAMRAQYDVLLQAYQQARGQFEHKEGAVKQRLQQIRVERLQQENARVPELIPEWKDPQKRSAGEQAMAKHYEATYGVSPQELNAHMQGALSMAVAYKAMKYDQLVRGKAEKVKQLRTAPPVTVPGAKSGSAKADQEKQLRDKLRRTGSLDDAAALLLNRMK